VSSGDLARIYRKFNRALEAGKGMRFSAHEMDVLTAAGLYDLLSPAVALELKEKAKARLSNASEQ
jgi:hypothetical protein